MYGMTTLAGLGVLMKLVSLALESITISSLQYTLVSVLARLLGGAGKN